MKILCVFLCLFINLGVVADNLGPSLKVLDVSMAYGDYDYDWDTFDSKGVLRIIIWTERSKQFGIDKFGYDSFLFEKPKDTFKGLRICANLPPCTLDTISANVYRMTFPYCDWGEYYAVWSVNDYGYTEWEKTICTTDYVTDPLVLERLKKLKTEEETSVEVFPREVKSINYICNELSFSGQGYVKRVEVINSVGVKVWKQGTGASINTLPWSRGIYIVKALYEDDTVLIKKIIKQ